MSAINWKNFTEESVKMIEAIADEYSLEYDVTTTHKERGRWGIKMTHKFETGYDEDFISISVEYIQDLKSTLEFSVIRVISQYEIFHIESVTFGDEYSEDLKDFGVFVDMENFKPDPTDNSSILHSKNEGYDNRLKEQSPFPDSEVNPYRKNFIDTIITDKISELIESQERYS